MRMWIPESPRWLMIHGHPDRAQAIVADIERSVIGHVQDLPREGFAKIRLRMRDHTPLREVAHTLFSTYRQRALVGLALMVAQAFFYNAIFFTFALVLTDFYGIASDQSAGTSCPSRPAISWARSCSGVSSTRSDAGR